MYIFCVQVVTRSRLLVAVNDLRAMPYISMATQAGAKHWACRYCNGVGTYVSCLDVVLYIGAARIMHQWPASRKTRRHASLLRQWKTKFRQLPDVIAQLDVPIARRDHAFRMMAGRVAEDAKSVSAAAHKRAVQAGGYHGVGQCPMMTTMLFMSGVPCIYCVFRLLFTI